MSTKIDPTSYQLEYLKHLLEVEQISVLACSKRMEINHKVLRRWAVQYNIRIVYTKAAKPEIFPENIYADYVPPKNPKTLSGADRSATVNLADDLAKSGIQSRIDRTPVYCYG